MSTSSCPLLRMEVIYLRTVPLNDRYYAKERVCRARYPYLRQRKVQNERQSRGLQVADEADVVQQNEECREKSPTQVEERSSVLSP